MTFVMGYKMHDEKIYEAHLYKDLRLAKMALIGSFAEVIKMTCSDHVVRAYLEAESAARELDEIFEEDFNLEYPTRTANIVGVDFLLGDVSLMKEVSVHQYDQLIKVYDQLIKVKTDHTKCTEDYCAHSKDND